LCTYNGAKFLDEQLQSFLAQSHDNWRLYLSDDSSTDATLGILQDFKQSVKNSHQVDITAGPRRGVAANFLTALCNAPLSEFCAISDQDDIWQPQKLSRALKGLKQISPSRPALYCGRTRLVDVNGRDLGLSPLFTRGPSFRNALVQNIGGGNTMVINRAAHELVRRAGADLEVVSHDWWLYQLISGAGGEVIYDPEPHVLYRQHRANLVGENKSLPAQMRRTKFVIDGRFRRWMNVNIAALDRAKALLTPENARLLRDFILLRQQKSARRRVSELGKLGIYRQTLLGTIVLSVAAALGKL
jgi:glycosyltransferase involved in cell wall biosynthesis